MTTVMEPNPVSAGLERFCNAVKRQAEGTCRKPAGWGTSHVGIGRCRLHGGKTPSQSTHAAVIQVRAELDRMGIPRDVKPGDALLELVAEAAGNVEFLRLRVQALGEDVTDEEKGANGAHKLVQHVAATMYADWSDRLANYSALAIKAGVEVAKVELAREQTDRAAEDLLGALERSFDAVGLDAAMRARIGAALAAELRPAPAMIEAGSTAR